MSTYSYNSTFSNDLGKHIEEVLLFAMIYAAYVDSDILFIFDFMIQIQYKILECLLAVYWDYTINGI